MATMNLQMLGQHNPVSFEFMPHQRSASASSTSSHHSISRPHSSQSHTGVMRGAMGPTAEDIYRASMHLDHVRASSNQSHSSAYSLTSNDLHTPAESPPNHNLGNPALKGALRPSHIRARQAASPYHRSDAESVYSSSSDTEDVAMFLGGQGPQTDYHPHHHSMYAAAAVQSLGVPDSVGGAFGRMTINPDQALERLASNVRAATTTSAADRAKQIFVQAWLTANYTHYPDGNVPRQGLYYSYKRICDQYGIPHINTATLGKAIRLCFPSIKTRRLGVRGNSKYHYCGIRPATAAEAEFLQDYIRKTNNLSSQPSINAARLAQDGDEDDEDDDSETNSGPSSQRNSVILVKESFGDDIAEKTPTAASLLSQAQASHRVGSYPAHASIRRREPTAEPTGLAPAQQQQQQASPSSANATAHLPFLTGQSTTSVRHMPYFPSIDEAIGAGSTSAQSIAARELWSWFQDHLDSLLDSVRSFRFDQFELNVRTFWGNLGPAHREVAHAPAIAGLMAKADANVYDEILEILRAQMLSPIPATALQNLRQLAVKMEQILLVSLDQYGNTFVEPKVELGARFGHLLLRFLDIYQVTQALTTVLTNPKQLGDMRRSWAKVNFDSVRNQSALVCNCRHEDLVQLLEVEFVSLLESLTKSVEPVHDVMTWADKCCERLMGGARGNGLEDGRGSMSSRSVLIRWGYVTSQVMRDLTIRSDASFGAFQILKLFLDDWIALGVLRTVALSTNSVAASVEPVMQQQFFSLSPMPGQESFGQGVNGLLPTPTTSSMLAALQADSFPGGGGDGPGSFASDFSSMPFMDPSVGGQDDGSAGLGFPDFSSASGAVDFGSSFGPADLGLGAAESPAAHSHTSEDPELVKVETPI